VTIKAPCGWWRGTGHRRPGQRLGGDRQRRHRDDPGRLGQRAQAEPDDVVLDRFTPSTWKSDNDTDQDLASTAPVLLPNGLVFQVGKLRTATSSSSRTSVGPVAVVRIGGLLWQRPRRRAAQSNGTVYVPCSDGLRAVTPTSSAAPVASWTTTTGAHSSPIVTGAYVLVDRGSTLYELNASNGSLYKSFPIGT